MKKLRIQKMPYINQGTANIRLKGVQEYHAIFKFDTDEEAEDFIKKVNEWYYDGTERTVSSSQLNPLLHDLNNPKDEKTEVVKTTRKKPGPKKGTGGRSKSDI